MPVAGPNLAEMNCREISDGSPRAKSLSPPRSTTSTTQPKILVSRFIVLPIPTCSAIDYTSSLSEMTPPSSKRTRHETVIGSETLGPIPGRSGSSATGPSCDGCRARKLKCNMRGRPVELVDGVSAVPCEVGLILMRMS